MHGGDHGQRTLHPRPGRGRPASTSLRPLDDALLTRPAAVALGASVRSPVPPGPSVPPGSRTSLPPTVEVRRPLNTT